MRRRLISVGSVVLAIAALALVLYNATVVDRRAPTIARVSLSAAAGGDPALAQTVTAIDIEFSEPVDHGSLERRFRIEPYVAGSFTWDRATAIFSPSAKLPQDTEFQVFVEPGFEDLAGNVATTGLDAWTFRTVGSPQVLAIVPADGADGVPVDVPITITFDRLMDTTAVEDAIQIQPAASFEAAWSGDTVALTLAEELDFGTQYEIRVSTGAADTDGNRLRTAFVARFSTVAAGLGIRATVPAGGVAGVGIRSVIAIAFDGPIEPSTIDGALQITPPVEGSLELATDASDSGPRPTSGSAADDPSVLVFRPSQPLAPHTTYTVTLEPVVAPLGAPDEVAAGRTWSFTTGQPAVSGQNQIAFFSDRAGVRNVWLMNPDGSNPRQLTTDLVPVAAFDVTTDGARVAWSAGGTVRTMAIDGSGERSLTTDGRFEYGPRFSPDGRSLILGRRDAGGADLGYWLVPLDPIAGDERQVLETGAPPLGSAQLGGDGIELTAGLPVWSARSAFSTDGQFLALTLADGGVRVIDLAAAADDAVADPGLVAAGAPVWSPTTGEFLVVARSAGDTGEGLYTVQTDGTAVRRFDATGSVAVSVDGRVGVLLPDGDATHLATRILASDSDPRPLTDEAALADRWPSFAPDGRSILFGRVATGAATASQGIWVADVVTGRLTRLTTDGAYPRWLP